MTMSLVKVESDVSKMLCETILALCKNTLPYKTELSIHGLLGITMDNQRIFLVDVNETSKLSTSVKRKLMYDFENLTQSSENESLQSEEAENGLSVQKKRKKKKPKRRRLSDTGNASLEESDMDYLKSDAVPLENKLSLAEVKQEAQEESHDCGIQNASRQNEVHCSVSPKLDSGHSGTVSQTPDGTYSQDTGQNIGSRLQFSNGGSLHNSQNLSEPPPDQQGIKLEAHGSLDNLAASTPPTSSISSIFNTSAPFLPSFTFPSRSLPVLPAVPMAVPLRDRPYHCPYCERAFTQKVHLKTHLRIHTGERPFRCDQCDKCFNQSNNLKRHMLIHENNSTDHAERPVP